MIDGKRVVAFIPARGGSKRCPRKNERRFLGKPLILWAIEQAKESRYIDKIVFSSEDKDLLSLASVDGCLGEVFHRPATLAEDNILNEDVIRFHLVADNLPHEIVVLLQPTSPLRLAEDIDACLEMMIERGTDGVISYDDRSFKKNGAVYVAKREWIEIHDFSHAGLSKYLMPEERSLDIDFEEQFR